MRWVTWMGTAAWLLAVAGEAQPAGFAGGRPGPHGFAAEMTYTAPGDLKGDGWDGGEVDMLALRANYTRRFELNRAWSASAGLGWDGTWFDVPAGAPLPENLNAVALRAGVQWRPSSKWTVFLEARPGVYSDFEDVGWEDVNVPVVVGAGYVVNTNLTVVLGMGVNWWSRLATIGGPGVIWQIAEDWRLNAVLPRPTIEWGAGEDWTLFAGGEIRGASWRLGEEFGREHGDADLDGDILGYREIRLGGGFRRAIGSGLRLTVEGGWAVDREFEFKDRERELDAGGAPYVQAGIAGSF
jgi:hypothetical protein